MTPIAERHPKMVSQCRTWYPHHSPSIVILMYLQLDSALILLEHSRQLGASNRVVGCEWKLCFSNWISVWLVWVSTFVTCISLRRPPAASSWFSLPNSAVSASTNLSSVNSSRTLFLLPTCLHPWLRVSKHSWNVVHMFTAVYWPS